MHPVKIRQACHEAKHSLADIYFEGNEIFKTTEITNSFACQSVLSFPPPLYPAIIAVCERLAPDTITLPIMVNGGLFIIPGR